MMISRRRVLMLSAMLIVLITAGSAALIVAMRPGLEPGLSGPPTEELARQDAARSPQTLPQSTQAPQRQPGGTRPVPADQAQPGSAGQQKPKKGMTLEDMTAHLKRNMDNAVAKAATTQDGAASQSDAEAAAAAVSPENATPEQPWPPRHLPTRRVEKSMMAPTPLPRKPRKDDHPNPSGNSVQILPGNPG